MYTVASPYPDPSPRGGGQLPNPKECISTLTSVTGGTYTYPDTYMYKYSLVVWNLGSPCNLRVEDTHICTVSSTSFQGCIRTTLAQSSDSLILIGRQFFKQNI